MQTDSPTDVKAYAPPPLTSAAGHSKKRAQRIAPLHSLFFEQTVSEAAAKLQQHTGSDGGTDHTGNVFSTGKGKTMFFCTKNKRCFLFARFTELTGKTLVFRPPF